MVQERTSLPPTPGREPARADAPDAALTDAALADATLADAALTDAAPAAGPEPTPPPTAAPAREGSPEEAPSPDTASPTASAPDPATPSDADAAPALDAAPASEGASGSDATPASEHAPEGASPAAGGPVPQSVPAAAPDAASASKGPAASETVSPGGGGRVLWARVVAGVVGGVALYTAFPSLNWWAAAPIGVGLIVASLYGTRPRRAAWLGYVIALVFLLPTLAWVRPIGDDVWLMLVATESVFYAVMAALAALVFRLRAWPLWFGGLWVAMEWARSQVPIGGFPWARLAFSQSESLFTQYAALGGAPLVSFAVALCGALLAYAALARPKVEGGWRRAVPAILALAVPVLTLALLRPGDEGRTVNVGIVQGNVPGRGMGFLGDEPAVVLKNHANETKRLAQAVREGKLPKPDAVVLPENSTDIDPYQDPYAREIIQDSVRDVGVPTLIGAVVAIGEDSRATRSLVWDPVTGPGAYYDKQHLVPFGEYTPFKDLVLALWERASLVGRQSVPGDKPGDLKLGPITIGAVNCYEVAYDDTVRGTVRAGGTVLAMQANNATYALSNLPTQQLAMYKLRAVEHNRAVVAAATTGISAYIRPDGKVSWQARELVADMNVVKVPVRTQETIATTVGAVPEWALMVMGAAAAGVAAWRGRRRGDRMRND